MSIEQSSEKKHDTLIAKGKHEDGSDIEVYEGSNGGAYFVHKNQGGEVVEFSNLIPQTEEGEIRQYFFEKGIALTDEDVKKIKGKLLCMEEQESEKKIDAMFESFDETKAREQ